MLRPFSSRCLAPALIAVLLGATPLARADVVDVNSLGSRTDERLALVVLYVGQSPAASDSNPGTATRPFRTIARAAQLAMDYNSSGVGVRVEIGAGTFRESVRLVATDNDTAAPMIFEATPGGGTIVKGSDVWTGWRSGGSGVYTHDWPYTWGLSAYPDGWSCCVVLSDLMRRREMIFANGQRLRQVLSKDDLTPGSFYVSEAQRQAFVRLPPGMAIETAMIEVAVRSALFFVQGRSNIVVRGLTFRHDVSPIGTTAALTLQNSSDVRVDQCTMEWNNFQGLGLSNLDHVSVTGTVSNSNGSTGIAGWKLRSVLLADGETSYNNWRGYESGFTDWDPAGVKLMLLRDTAVLRHKANGNLSYGFWLDTDCVNILIDSLTSTDNYNDGLFLEAVLGPIEVRQSVLSNNRRAGVLGANASGITLSSNVMTGNGASQLLISGTPAGRSGEDYVSGRSYTAQSAGWALSSNVIKADIASEALVSTTLPEASWQAFVSSLVSDWNVWFNSSSKAAFRWTNGLAIDFETWKRLTRQDPHSCSCN
jgi:Right handed beta helix region